MEFSKDDTKLKVIELVAQKLNIGKDRITSAASFQDLGADSLDMVEIIMKLEEQFGLEINDEDAENMTDIDQVVEYIYKKRTK
jgi:acyl carrier protein